ncbi:MAG TPA: GAF domain-containing sensor histidine kinase [Acidimicrobiia bacterium]|nr:GAF domain-containing sensor histidine kinase [Acidimicrobiia bacterium]
MTSSPPYDPTYDRISPLIEAAASVVGETDLDHVLRRLVAEALTATGAGYGALGVIGEHGVLSDFLYEGVSAETAAAIGHLPSGKGVLGTVIRLNKTIRLDDISKHPDSVGFPKNHPPMKTFLGVPISVGDVSFGRLYLTEKPGGFTDQDVMVVEALSRIAGSAVKTARLQERMRRLAVVEDRQRIARELHDSVIQEMFAVGLGLQGLSQLVDSPQAEATLLDAVDRLDNAVETLRNYIFELKRSPTASQDLDSRLTDVVTRMGSAYPAGVRLELDLQTAIASDLEDEVVAIVTEAVSNALRHSSASMVEVTVATKPGSARVTVEDNGIGFDPDTPSTGMGLQNLRQRVMRRGGELDISSSDRGTRVAAEIPLS